MIKLHHPSLIHRSFTIIKANHLPFSITHNKQLLNMESTAAASLAVNGGSSSTASAFAAREVLRLASRLLGGEHVCEELRDLVHEEIKTNNRSLSNDIEHLTAALDSILELNGTRSSDRPKSTPKRRGLPHSKDGGISGGASSSSSPYTRANLASSFASPTKGATAGGGGGSSHSSRHSYPPAPPDMAILGKVLNNPSLLLEILDFVVEPRANSRSQLGALSLVGRLWRDLATSDVFWKPVSIELFPALPGALSRSGSYSNSSSAQKVKRRQASNGEGGNNHSSNGSGHDRGEVVVEDNRYNCRAQVMRYGKALGEPRYRTTSAWQEGLSMVYEVTDAADGRRLFYGTGPIHVAVGQNVILRLTGSTRHEVSEAFSAADRDPGLQRFPTVRDFFKACHGSQYPASLRVRVVICDQLTGKMALLYHSGKSAKRHAKVPNASYWQDYLPEDSLYIWDADSVFFGSEGQVKLAAAFYVVALEGQEDADIDDKERLYRIAGGDTERYGLHSSYVSLDFSTTDGEAVGRFIKSLLI